MYKHGAVQELTQLRLAGLHCRWCGHYRPFEPPGLYSETSPSTRRSLSVLQGTLYPGLRKLYQFLIVSRDRDDTSLCHVIYSFRCSCPLNSTSPIHNHDQVFKETRNIMEQLRAFTQSIVITKLGQPPQPSPYAPLPNPNSIRLLDILPARRSHPIQTTLTVTDLDHASSFEALSYV
jgi:hypothetical protein